MRTTEWICLAAGAAIGVGFCWVRDKFIIIEYKLEKLENPETSRTNAEGKDGDPETEDVQGQIGFIRGEHG